MLYLWVKAFHLIFVIGWMAGLLILPRYKLHQLTSAPGEPLFETMKSASAKLRKIILTPSVILVWVLGISLIVINPAIMSGGWLHAKILLVILLSGLHGYFVAMGKKIDRGEDVPAKRLKMLNEVPFILLIVIVILVIVQPF
ncbi:CopD family protein [Henriciella barbarensis]|uniref:Protoporphyrinogen IX oxidase n=1 Tax=Henriciella barbarensis TaxID=86342 RepID=A0A399R1J6_9PROT|nr:CopD family protein [Henriciella barbarensis]RIJ24105.1 CopD family protein [Henriciella barbarensis]